MYMYLKYMQELCITDNGVARQLSFSNDIHNKSVVIEHSIDPTVQPTVIPTHKRTLTTVGISSLD